MTFGPSPPRRRRFGRMILLVLGALIVGGIIFVLGVGLGQALEETPPPGGVRTHIRTLETVTVTVRP